MRQDKGTKGLIPRKTEYSQLEKKDQGITIIKIVFNLSSKNKNRNLKINFQQMPFQQIDVSYTYCEAKSFF